MKILWFTSTPSLYDNKGRTYNGGGWIESLEELITRKTDIELGVSFFHPSDKEKKRNGNVTYYPILLRKRSNVDKFIHNWSCRIESEKYSDLYLKVVEEFKPDLIQIFGTEGPFGIIQSLINIPVVIHLQGLVYPYSNYFYPPRINGYSILFHPGFLKNNMLGNSLAFDKRRFDKMADRELSYLKNSKYLMGRTKWDKTVSKLLAPQAIYFHIDEVLRPLFYKAKEWVSKQSQKVIIVSTISNTIYKGFDLILKAAKLIKENSSLLFEWHVLGLREQDKLIAFFERQLNLKYKDYNIVIRGTKTSDEIINIICDADVFVHPSYIDNSPNSLCEAQFLGIPVIACDVGGVSTIIENNVSGVLVPANAPYELAYQIISLSTDKIKAEYLGKSGRKAATLRHDPDKILADLLGSYKKIIDIRTIL